MYLPVELSRPAKVAYPLGDSVSFGRGAAFYFMVPATVDRLSMTFEGRNSAALYDPNWQRVAWDQWYEREEPCPHHFSVECPQGLRDRPWCFIHGCSGTIYSFKIGPAAAPRFFSDRPERFFVPMKGATVSN